MIEKETKFCANCGAEVDVKALTCPSCGVVQQDQIVKTTSIKNEGLAAVLSFLFVGLGQIYNGQIGKGILLIIIQIVNVCLMFFVIGFLTYPLVWVYGVWDAYNTAKNINAGTETV